MARALKSTPRRSSAQRFGEVPRPTFGVSEYGRRVDLLLLEVLTDNPSKFAACAEPTAWASRREQCESGSMAAAWDANGADCLAYVERHQSETKIAQYRYLSVAVSASPGESFTRVPSFTVSQPCRPQIVTNRPEGTTLTEPYPQSQCSMAGAGDGNGSGPNGQRISVAS